MNAEEKAEVKGTDIKMDSDPTNEPIEVLTDRNAAWRDELRKSMKPKERTQIERVVMPELDPVYRATTRTEEVNIGLTKEMAMTEAKRCLDCAKPTCVEGCPVNINIPSFIKNIERGQFLAAARKSPRSIFLMNDGILIFTGQPSTQEGLAQSRQRLASVIAISLVRPIFTSSVRVVAR